MPKHQRIRNYRKEYDNFFGVKHLPHTWNALQKRRRKEKMKRNQARRWFTKKYGKRRLKGRDIDHRNGNAMDNRWNNLRICSINSNRSRNKKTTAKRWKK